MRYLRNLLTKLEHLGMILTQPLLMNTWVYSHSDRNKSTLVTPFQEYFIIDYFHFHFHSNLLVNSTSSSNYPVTSGMFFFVLIFTHFIILLFIHHISNQIGATTDIIHLRFLPSKWSLEISNIYFHSKWINFSTIRNHTLTIHPSFIYCVISWLNVFLSITAFYWSIH